MRCHNPGYSGQRGPMLNQVVRVAVFKVSSVTVMVKGRATDRSGDQHGPYKAACEDGHA